MTCEIKKSTHQALVVPITLEPHFNADKLSIVKIDDYTCVVATADWQGKTKAVYCPPDSLVNTELPQFNFLAKDAKFNKEGYPLGTYARVRARNIRLIQSWGLLAPCDESEPIGKDMAPEWGIGHYDPPTEGETDTHPDVRVTGGEVAPSPEGYKDMPKYDIDSGMKYARKLFEQDEPIVATLKFNGCFHEDSKVMLANGEERCISEILINDKILSFNETTEQYEVDTVEKVISSKNSKKWIKLTFNDNKSVKCTEDHLFLTKNRGWIKASDISTEDDLVSLF